MPELPEVVFLNGILMCESENESFYFFDVLDIS